MRTAERACKATPGLAVLADELQHWLVAHAYPLWATRGVDTRIGGFHERLSQEGEPLIESRRARVQTRQAFAFAQAPALGWKGDATAAIDHALRFFEVRYRRADGFFRTLIDADGRPEDDRVVLYDQTFTLLSWAEVQKVLGARPDIVKCAAELRTLIYRYLRRSTGGFDSGLPERLPLLSNPHMHLFEAGLAWLAIAEESHSWRLLVEEIASLALTHFIDAQSGALHESFDAAWCRTPGIPGRMIEPGHQYEWAWLLLRWSGDTRPLVRSAALRLIDFTERHGVREDAAVNVLLDDGSVHDGTARLWPQTERLKASLLAAQVTGDVRYWAIAESAARTLRRFLDTKLPGLWFDSLSERNEFVDEPAPASSFYHLVSAISQLRTALQ